jgi:hypothetical protein
MRLSGVMGALILTIAVYFALFWGFDAMRVLTSPTYGLEDVWRSQVVFGIGRYAGFGPEGLIRLAAVLGALKFVVAGVCAIHVVERLRSLFARTTPSSEMLETALILAVAVTVASLVPAIWSQNADLMREQVVQLILAGATGAFCVVERSGDKPATPAEMAAAEPAAVESASYVPWHR